MKRPENPIEIGPIAGGIRLLAVMSYHGSVVVVVVVVDTVVMFNLRHTTAPPSASPNARAVPSMGVITI